VEERAERGKIGEEGRKGKAPGGRVRPPQSTEMTPLNVTDVHLPTKDTRVASSHLPPKQMQQIARLAS